MLPRARIAALDEPWRWSLHMANGLGAFETLLLGLQVLGGLALLVGVRTRIATLFCWVLVALGFKLGKQDINRIRLRLDPKDVAMFDQGILRGIR